MLLVIAGGLWAMTRLQVEMFPDVDFPLIVLSTVYPEADAETVLQDVTIPMENVNRNSRSEHAILANLYDAGMRHRSASTH